MNVPSPQHTPSWLSWLRRLWWLPSLVLLGLVFPSPSARLLCVVQQDELLWRLEWLAILIAATAAAIFLQQRLGRWHCAAGLAAVLFACAASAQWLRQHRLALDLPVGWSLMVVGLFVLVTFLPRRQPPAPP